MSVAPGVDERGVSSGLRGWVMVVHAQVCVQFCACSPLPSGVLQALMQDGAGQAAGPPG